ncbi:MAG: DNA polymerase III subunit gamma/tau [Candidatus Omnitrophota bacterium]|nr:MAG: DNA polymerase III subunit gamma/tau [Candidatus Omnitrophota bacterium]
MSYIVFALKWRPNNFDQIVGQDKVVATLKNAIQKDRLAHAYLFAGPRGVGKTSTARILAKALNCKKGTSVEPCGVCPVCVDIAAGRSLDVIEIDGASNRGIDEIRALREGVKFSPTQGRHKVYIIDEVHQITSEGFNALLKTLEEPPPFVKFIFATTHPHKVIPTILSRCQRLDFRRISIMEIIAQLEKIARAEKINVDEKVLFAIAKSSDGSLRDAESILDQLSSFAKDNISLKDVVTMLGWIEQDFLFNITNKIIQKDARAALGLLNEIRNKGKDISVLFRELIEHFRNLMIAKVALADSNLIDLPKEICDKLLEQSQSFSLQEIFSAFNILMSAQEISRKMEFSIIPLEIGIIKLAENKKEKNSKKTMLKESSAQDKQPVSGQLKTENFREEEKEKMDIAFTPPENNIVLDDIKSSWDILIDNLAKIKMSVATYMSEGSPIKSENNILTVAFPVNYSLHKESLEDKDNRALIEKTLTQIFNTQVRIKFVLSKDIANNKEEHHSNSFIKSAIETFKGRVIKQE